MRVTEQIQSRISASLIASLGRLCIGIGLTMLTAITFILSGRMIPGRRELPNPYLAVRDFFDGDARQMAVARGFTCTTPNYAATHSDFCRFSSLGSTYQGIDVLVEGGETRGAELLPVPNTFTLGDLVLSWGTPQNTSYCEKLVVWWSIARLTAVAAVSRTNTMNYFAPVLSLSFFPSGTPSLNLPLLHNTLRGCWWD